MERCCQAGILVLFFVFAQSAPILQEHLHAVEILPRVVGTLATSGDAHCVAASGSYAYVTTNQGLEVIDIDDVSVTN